MMTFQKDAFVKFLIFTIAFNEVASWTIDLPEIRKYLFEKNEKNKKYENTEEHHHVLDSDQTFYSNIEGDSPHNTDHHENHENEDEYRLGYDHGYMEKKVYDIVRDGSTYLEGLRRSLEDYNDVLENCNKRNDSSLITISTNSTWRPQYDPPSSPMNMTFNSSSILNFDNYESSVVPNRPNSSESRSSETRSGGKRLSCREATDASENVRRYADLAMWATKRLQDLAYAKQYQKTDELEENELVLKLAWFLDRLAYLTGYEPDYKDNDYDTSSRTRTTTPPPTAQTLVPSSPELTKELMECLKRNSSVPATVRCRYPLPMPDLMDRVINNGTTPSPPEASDPSRVLPMESDNQPAQSSEILITADSYPSTVTAQKSVTKRSTEYSYYFPSKPLHEVTYPAPILKLIKHRLSNIKSIVKTIVEKRLAHIAEKKEEKEHDHFEKHFAKRSIDDSVVESSNFINPIASPKLLAKSVEKPPIRDSSLLEVIHYPISDVSIINTKSFKKRSIDERRATPNFINRLSNLKSIVKSIEKGPIVRKMFENFISSTRKDLKRSKKLVKRSADDPMSKLANYYIKYKVWDASNPVNTKKSKKLGVFEVKNHLTEPKSVQKRSLFNKKVVHFHVPKPFELIRTYAHNYKHTNYHTIHIPTLLAKIQKLHDLKHKKVEKIEKHHHHKLLKRSLHYENMYLPRVSMDPHKDISYYVKSKEGTEYRPSLQQAAQVRLGLEQVFQTGNIEVIRRYGSNFNPLNPAPLYTGILLSMADA